MIEEVQKIKLMLAYFNRLEEEYRKLLYSLDFMEWKVNWALDKAENYGADRSHEDLNTKIKENEEMINYFRTRMPFYVKGLTEEQINTTITNYETDIAYLEHSKELFNYYEDLIFKTKDLINNSILNLMRNTLGIFYGLISPLLPNYDKNTTETNWNIDEILDFLVKYDTIKNKENKSLSLKINE